MCGRYTQFTTRKRFAELAGLPVNPANPYGETVPSWNVTPGRACTLVRAPLNQSPELVNLLWGLIPHWATTKPTTSPINARLETAGEKPMFRRIFRFRRCLVAADGWYEWRATPEGKQPYFLCFADRRPLFFGGLWDEWRGPQGLVPTFTILTRPPTPNISHIHDRMPVILDPSAYGAWLDKGFDDPARIADLCAPPAPNHLVAYRVSPVVGRASAEGPELIAPL